MNRITKQFRAEIAHRLPNHPGACRFLHGHSYLFEVTVEGDPSNNPDQQMVMDFSHLKEQMQKVIGPWDHSTVLYDDDPLLAGLSDLCFSRKELAQALRVWGVPFIPTAENMAQYIFNRLSAMIVTCQVVNVRVWETATSYADYSGN